MASRSQHRASPNAPVKTAGGESRMNNEILLRLPRKERDTLQPSLEFVEMPTHSVLHEAGEPITHGYFVNDGLASFLNVMGDGKSVEVGLTGRDGFVGLPLIVGFHSSPTRVVAQVAGAAYRITAPNLAKAMRQCPQLQRELNRFAQVMMMQAAQIAACNRIHEVDERLARWLLMSQDRLTNNRIPLTQEFLAHMLGTRRASVTVAAGTLQRAGLIQYTRGEVSVVSRQGLEDASCECYQSMVTQTKNWQNESEG
jgi:CRP-like cAMP-binding protein